MALSEILASIDREIAKLQAARAVLSSTSFTAAKKKPGRPRKAENDLVSVAAELAQVGKRKISPEGRKRIAEAVKKRWALHKKSAAAAGK